MHVPANLPQLVLIGHPYMSVSNVFQDRLIFKIASVSYRGLVRHETTGSMDPIILNVIFFQHSASLRRVTVLIRICLRLVEQYCLQQRHLMAVEGVNEASLQQVQDLDRAVAGATDQEVVRRVDGKAVDGGTMHCTIRDEGGELK